MKKKMDLFLITYMFIIIFEPPIIYKVSLKNVIGILSVIYIVINYRRIFKYVARRCKLNKFFIPYIICLFYILIVVGMNIMFSSATINDVDYIQVIKGVIKDYILLASCTLVIVERCYRLKYSIEDYIKILIIVGIIQASITLCSFISPSIKNFLVSVISNNIKNERTSMVLTLTSGYRSYGFASNMFDMYGYSTALLVSIALIMGIFSKFKYVLIALFLIIMPLLNARTGILIVIIGFICTVFYSIKGNGINIKKIMKIIVTVCMTIIGIKIGYTIINKSSPQTILFIKDGLEQITSLLNKGEKTGTLDIILTDKFWYFTDNTINLIFGTGHTTFTDVGYVNSIWAYGIVGSILFFSIYLKLFRITYKSTNNIMLRCIVASMFLSFWFYMLKLNSFGFNAGTAVIVPLCFLIIFTYNSKIQPSN